ncbi:MAG: hypothetical protein F6K26_34340, partial [Moorea sp. SIO2I5]|nr:hypothetical protein [Moorena sp. SIO2I5]
GSVNLQNQLDQLGGEGRAILASSTDYSFSQLDKQLSIYTQYLVEGIETGDADLNRDRVISLDELHEYIEKRIRETFPDMKPKIYTDQEGSKIHIANAPRNYSPVSDTPLVTPEGINASPQADSLITRTLPNKLLSKLVIIMAIVVILVSIGVPYLEKEFLYCKYIYIKSEEGELDANEQVYNRDSEFNRRCQLFKYLF